MAYYQITESTRPGVLAQVGAGDTIIIDVEQTQRPDWGGFSAALFGAITRGASVIVRTSDGESE